MSQRNRISVAGLTIAALAAAAIVPAAAMAEGSKTREPGLVAVLTHVVSASHSSGGMHTVSTLGGGAIAAGIQGTPDAVDRYLRANTHVAAAPTLKGAPDAIDRFIANRAASTGIVSLGGSPDAVDRYVGAHQRTALALGGPPDAIDRFRGRTITVSVAAEQGFAWDEFGIGAVAMVGLMLLVGALGFALPARFRGRLRPS